MGQGCEELAALNRNAEALRRSLEGKIEGEARFDPLSRALYATDASVYQIMPAGVVIPRVRDDAVAAVRAALSHGVPITPRGAGTSLGGQAIGTGLVVDFSKYMNRVIKINSEERWAWVEPGIVLDDLNAALGRMGLQFAPDVATSNRATIGGMIGNNSAGARSLLYGKTIDHVLELDVILGDGNVARFSQLDGSALEAKQESDGLESHCHRIVTQLAREHADEIERRYPKIMRRVAGYNLDEFVPGRPFNLSKIIVGAEGTLAVVVAARIRLTPLPKAKSLLVIHFADLRDALKASAPILAHNPAAIEFLDRNVLERTKDSLEYARLRGFVVGDPDGLLIVEFFGESKGELAERSDRLEQDLRACGIGYHYHRAIEKEAQAQIWKLRKASLGLVMATKGDAKPIPFVEDAAVAPERLAEFVDRFIGIVEANGTTAAFYGHASVGALHLRPIINLKTDQGVRQFETIA
ncbi:FAD-binding oxidoreductase, partial [Candidatus Sumerlaeota bacterium]|nr:FAD-binding oxidoreductase [Candidatus Sumerlaeota bacterium]